MMIVIIMAMIIILTSLLMTVIIMMIIMIIKIKNKYNSTERRKCRFLTPLLGSGSSPIPMLTW